MTGSGAAAGGAATWPCTTGSSGPSTAVCAAGVPRRGLRDHRRERRGQVDAAAHDRRPAPPDDGLGPVRRQGRDRAAARAPGHAGDRHGAGGQAAVRVAVRRGKPAGRRHVRAARARGPSSGSTSCSAGCESTATSSPPSFPAMKQQDARHRPRTWCARPRALLLDELALGPARHASSSASTACCRQDPGDQPRHAARQAGREPGPAGGRRASTAYLEGKTSLEGEVHQRRRGSSRGPLLQPRRPWPRPPRRGVSAAEAGVSQGNNVPDYAAQREWRDVLGQRRRPRDPPRSRVSRRCWPCGLSLIFGLMEVVNLAHGDLRGASRRT